MGVCGSRSNSRSTPNCLWRAGSLRVFVYFQHLTNRSAAETLSNRVSNPFPLETYKSLFQQLLCFVIYTKHPAVTPSIFHRQPLGSANAPPSSLSLRGQPLA